jgi:DNA-binding IclR family transcriptional regulator
MESSVLVKSFSVLEALANQEHPIGLAELVAVTRFSKPTVHRVLQSLIAMGYVAAVGGGAYQLTGKLRQLSLGPADRWLASLGEPVLRRVLSQTGETVNLGVLRHNQILYVSILESDHALRRVARVQEADPVLCTALGRAIAASLSEKSVDLLIRTQVIEPRTSKTIVDPRKLRLMLLDARKNGFAVERDETDLGVTCIGVPVFWRGEVTAAISISAASARMDRKSEKRCRDALMKAAKTLEQKLVERERLSA